MIGFRARVLRGGPRTSEQRLNRDNLKKGRTADVIITGGTTEMRGIDITTNVFRPEHPTMYMAIKNGWKPSLS